MNGGWRIARIWGVDVRVDASWALIAVVIVYSLSNLYAQRPDITKGPAFLLAVVTAVLFFLSILGHELAHAGVCKARGIPVAGITLYMLGGATHAQLESRKPVDEFLVTAVGPGSTLAIGGLFLVSVHVFRGHVPLPVLAMLQYLGGLNLFMGVLNLLPAFPLDGGRLLLSIVWQITGNLATATRVAARLGQVLGAAMAAVGLFVATRSTGDLTLGLWLVFIGIFLYRGASDTLARRKRQSVLESATVRDVMSPPPPSVPADMRLEDAVHRYLMGHEGEAFPVVEGDRVIGFVSLGTARGVPLDRPVREAMVGTDGTVQAGPTERLDQVAQRLAGVHSRTALVIDEGRLIGVLEPEDLAGYLRRKTNGERSDALPPPPRPDAP
jgi:Zn-dependent protease